MTSLSATFFHFVTLFPNLKIKKKKQVFEFFFINWNPLSYDLNLLYYSLFWTFTKVILYNTRHREPGRYPIFKRNRGNNWWLKWFLRFDLVWYQYLLSVSRKIFVSRANTPIGERLALNSITPTLPQRFHNVYDKQQRLLD